MRILKDQKQGTYTLVPIEQGELTLVQDLLAGLSQHDKLKYHGRVEERGESMVLRFNFGGKPVRVPFVVDGEECGSTPGYDGGLTFNVGASDEESQEALGFMRDMCFFATGGLIFLEKVEIDGVTGICCTGGFCKSCRKPVIGISAKNGFCDTCAETRCEHEYEETVFLAPAFGGMVAGDLCKHCKRISPDSFDRLKQTPKLQRLEEATAIIRQHVPNFVHFLGGPEDPLCITIEEASALRDHGTIPSQFQELVDDNPEAQSLFAGLAEDMRQRV